MSHSKSALGLINTDNWYHIVLEDQGQQGVAHRVEIHSEEGDDENSERGTDDAMDSQGSERHHDGSDNDEGEDDEMGVAQGGQYGTTVRQGHVSKNAFSHGGEENVIEVPDESDEEQEHQLGRQDTRSERSEEVDEAPQPVGIMRDQEVEELNASEESFDGSDSYQSQRESHGARSEKEDTNSIIEDGDDVMERINNNESPYARDDGVDELADDELQQEEAAAYVPPPHQYAQPGPTESWAASQFLDPALQTGTVLQSAVTEVTYVSSDAHVANHVSQPSSFIAINETVQSSTIEPATSVQPELSTPMASLRQEDTISADVQIVDTEALSVVGAEERRDENTNELTSTTPDEHTVPADDAMDSDARHVFADVPESSAATVFDRQSTPLLSRATPDYEAVGNEPLARHLPSTSPSKETFANMDSAVDETETFDHTGNVQGASSSSSGEDQEMEGVAQEGSDNELEADTDVSYNGHYDRLQATGASEAVKNTPQTVTEPWNDVAAAVQRPVESNADGLEVHSAGGDIEAAREKVLESGDSNTGFVVEVPVVSNEDFPVTQPLESNLRGETSTSLHTEYSEAGTGVVPIADPHESPPQEHDDEERTEDPTVTSKIANADQDAGEVPFVASDEDIKTIPVPQEMANSEHAPDLHRQEYREATSNVAFDGSAEFVAIASPTESGKDELEEGEIRSSDEADMGGELITHDEIGNDSAIEDEKSIQGYDDSQEEGDGAAGVNLSLTQNADGIRRGVAEVMGSRQEGVREDELATMEEGECLNLFPFP